MPAAPWTARIAGVASKAVILLADDGAAISIVGTEENLDARAFVITQGFEDFLAEASAALSGNGETASMWYNGKMLSIVSSRRITAHTETARVWDPRDVLEKAARGLDGHKLHRIANAIELEVRAAHESGRSHDGIHSAGPFALAFRRLQAAPDFPANLVGFGPGSTPAGDDWLSGYLTGRDLVEGGPGQAQKALRATLAGALERTTPAGRALLLGAIAGGPPAYLVELAQAATAGIHMEAKVREAVLAALEHGATSGEDAIVGFMEALRQSSLKPRCGMI